MELGIHAIEIVSPNGSAYYKESVAIDKNYSFELMMDQLCDKAGLQAECYMDDDTDIYIYDTLTFKGNRNGEYTRYYRYNELLEIEDIDNDLILERIKLIQDWFAENTDETTGRFQYEYYPSSDNYSESTNDTRMTASLWAAAELGGFLNDDTLNEETNNMLDYFLDRAVCKDNYCYIASSDGDKPKIAHNAFIIMVLLNKPDYPNRDAWVTKLSEGILSRQKSNGEFYTHFNTENISGEEYYPGEAMLALMMIYEETEEEKYLTAVEKAFPFYQQYWRDDKNTAMIPWHTQAYTLLYEQTEDSKLKDFIFEMNDWLINNHQIESSPYYDEVGGFHKTNTPKTVSTTTYLEGINDAYQLALDTNDNEHIAMYRESIENGTRFLLLAQYTKKNSFYLDDPERAIGGFRTSLIDNSQRIDCQQHGARTLMKEYENDFWK